VLSVVLFLLGSFFAGWADSMTWLLAASMLTGQVISKPAGTHGCGAKYE
jgi:hypothetical protein